MVDFMDVPTILSIAAPTAIFTAGTTWGATRKAFADSEVRIKALEKEQAAIVKSIVRIETMLDVLIKHDPQLSS